MIHINKCIVLFVLITFLGVGALFLNQSGSSSTSDNKMSTSQESPSNGDMIGCTEEARECPDGSIVIRTLPNCEFEGCPQDVADTEQPQIPSSWIYHSNTNYSLKYPPEVKVVDSENDQFILTFMGQKQIDSGRTQTELFDGYSFRIGEISDVDSADLQAVAMLERSNAEEHCNNPDGVVSPVATLEISGKSAYQYSATGCRIDFTETIVSNGQAVFRISQTYVGDDVDQQKYKEITHNILGSLEL